MNPPMHEGLHPVPGIVPDGILYNGFFHNLPFRFSSEGGSKRYTLPLIVLKKTVRFLADWQLRRLAPFRLWVGRGYCHGRADPQPLS